MSPSKRWLLASLSLCFAAFGIRAQAVAAPAGDPLAKVGKLALNFGEFKDWNPTWVFTDAMKAARPWIPQYPDTDQPWNNGDALTFNENGWPLLQSNQAATTLLFREMEGVYPAGVYNVFWEGTGELIFDLDATLIEQVSAQHARIDVVPDWTGIMVKIVASELSDPVRNIRVIMPGFESSFETQVFHPDFLVELDAFGALRFMQWQNTNFSTLSEWADRPTPAYFSQATDVGMAVEHMVELANTAGKGPWFSMPAMASDDFVRNFARYVAENLDPELPVFIEYANEVWNDDFLPFSHAQQQAFAAGIQGTPFDVTLKWYSQRSVQIFQIWRQEFEAVSGAAWSDRLVRVLAAQHANPYTSELVLDYQDAYLETDVLALAPYFGNSYGTSQNQWSTLGKSDEQILSELTVEVQTSLTQKINANVAVAKARGVELIAYEGGQHLVAVGSATSNQQLVDKLISVNRNAGMYDVYGVFLAAWENAGAGFMTPYSFVTRYDEYGSFGHKEYLDQPLGEAHKFRALVDYADVAAPDVVEYGSGCQDLVIDYAGVPATGLEFSVSLAGAAPNGVALLNLSANNDEYSGLQLPLDLGYLGAIDCELLVGEGTVFSHNADLNGEKTVVLSIPSLPELVGNTYYLQWAAGVPGFGEFGFGMTGALAVTISG